MKKFLLIKRKGQWFMPNSDKPFPVLQVVMDLRIGIL